jgi:hypothetical protein
MTSLLNRAPGARPRSRALIRLDLYNAYARLGVSPLLSTEEIKAAVQRKRKELMRRRRARTQQQFGEEEAEITALQAIEDEIGSPRARARYDQAHPQNELLTIQPSPHDRWLDPKHRSGLVTDWLLEELGRDVLLPSPESLRFWAPRGLDPEVAAFLAEFAIADAGGPAPPSAGLALPEVADLERLLADGAEPLPEPPAPGRAGGAPSAPDPTEESFNG